MPPEGSPGAPAGSLRSGAVRAAAHVVLAKAGGQGAVRELCELILRAKGSWRI